MQGRVRIKICGIGEPGHARAAAEAGADAIGLVFADGSPRRIDAERAAEVARAVGPFVERVGLFTDAEPDEIGELAARIPLTMAQLHGGQSADEIAGLTPLRVMRAVHFEPDSAADTLRRWDAHYRELENLAAILLDTPDPRRAGGTGRAFDWDALRSVLDRVRPEVPIVLAGGLNAENVAEAVRTVRPWAVDVSSGVEAERGVKDPQRIRAFCEAASAAGTSSG